MSMRQGSSRYGASCSFGAWRQPSRGPSVARAVYDATHARGDRSHPIHSRHHRTRDPCGTAHAQQDVHARAQPGASRFRGSRAERAGRSAGGCVARHAAGHEQARRGDVGHGGAGAALHHRRTLPLGSQELLLSRPAQGLSDQPVRPAAVQRRLLRSADGRRHQAHRHHPRAPGGGHRQAGPRAARRFPLRRKPGRSQSRRHAAARDRHRARLRQRR